jgi:hypothetical protein
MFRIRTASLREVARETRQQGDDRAVTTSSVKGETVLERLLQRPEDKGLVYMIGGGQNI